MRPGVLYFSIFIWLVFTGGRFTAPFLQAVAGFDDALVGVVIAGQVLIASFLGSIGAVFADRLESKYPERGRVILLSSCIIFGSMSFQFHSLVRFMFDNNSEKNEALSDESRMRNEHLCTTFHVITRLFYAGFSSIIFPVLDGITLSYLRKHHCNNTASYGQERLFGAVAWAIASLIIGPILDRFNYDIFFISCPVGAIICLLTFAKYTKDSIKFSKECEQIEDKVELSEMKKEVSCENDAPPVTVQKLELEKERTHSESVHEENFSKKEITSFMLLKMMLSTYTAYGFVASAWILNMGMSVVENLIFLYFEELGGTNAICALTVFVTVIFEIPIFHYAPQFLAYFGAEKLQIIACLAYIIRVFGYTLVPKEHMALILLFEPLHGVTYACSKTAAVEFAARITPEGREASGQGILSMLLGIGSVVGLSLGGWIEEAFGAKILYRSYALIVTIGLVIFSVAMSKERCTTSARYDKIETPTENKDFEDVNHTHVI